MTYNPQAHVQALGRNPKKFIDNARKGDLLAFRDIANLWQEFPEMLSMGVIDLFYFHLSKEPPTDTSRATYERTPTADRAFMSIVGLSKLSTILRDGHPYEEQMLEGWPSLFKWSAYMIASRVQSQDATPLSIRITSEAVCGCWYSVSRTDSVRHAMVRTKGTIEIAAKLWTNEDLHADAGGPSLAVPTPSACLDALLFDAIDDYLDRMLKTCGGNPENVAKLAMSRLKSAINAKPMNDVRISVYLDLVGHMSRKGRHPLRHAFLSANIITICTKLAVNVAKMLNQGAPEGFLNVLCGALGYLSNCLESTDGFTWIIQALNSGMLIAWADASPHYHKLDPSDLEMLNHIVEDIIPRYLVYRSVINAVDGSMKKLDDDKLPHRARVLKSIVKDVYLKFHELAIERALLVIHARAVKGKAATCDNAKCQKVDAKNNFQKCSGCGSTLYCSKECQVIAWKDGGHKTMCKLKQQERREGKLQSISKSDGAFFHDVAVRDARHHLPYLQRLAKKEHPDRDGSEFIICIDYRCVPPKYTLSLLCDYEKNQPASDGASVNAEARNDAFVERARDNPGKFVIIQSTMSNGQTSQLVTSLVPGGFWQSGSMEVFEDPEDDEEGPMDDPDDYRNTDLDAIQVMRARMMLNNITSSLGMGRSF